jgi:hypothetical protein
MTPQVPTCGDGTCNGTETCSNCVPDCACLIAGQTCLSGVCVTQTACTDTCNSLGYNCGFHNICGTYVNCGSCEVGEDCNSTYQCVIGTCDDTCTNLGHGGYYGCGWLNVCGLSTYCGTCQYGFECINNACNAVGGCSETCGTLGYACGNHMVCGASTNCGSCPSGTETCNANGVCVVNSCSNGIPDNGETGTDCGGPCKDCVITATTGNIYYVAPDGSDSYPGTITQPWKTWQKAFDSARAGDLVYFRGGVYYYNSTSYSLVRYSGTVDKPIRFFAYPGDSERPALDLKFKQPTYPDYGILINNRSFPPSNLHFKGLEVRNLMQLNPSMSTVRAVEVLYGDNITFENMVVHDNGGKGFAMAVNNSGTITIINCDSYNNFDLYNYGTEIQTVNGLENSLYIGGGGGGMAPGAFNDSVIINVYGCRTWNNSDGGIHIGGTRFAFYNNSWSFFNGRALGDGDGFKGHMTYEPPTDGSKISVTNCISAGNRIGYDRNNDANLWVFYNNFAYYNGYNVDLISGMHRKGAFYFWGGPQPHIFRNNIAYDNSNATRCTTKQTCFSTYVVQSNNNWNSVVGGEWAPYDLNVQVSDADFVSLDMTQLMLPRHANGSLPDITFGHLRSDSDLIDAGVDVGIPHLGDAPDLGAFENS